MKLLIAFVVFILATAVSAGVISSLVDALTFNAEQDVFFWLYTQKNPTGLKITRDVNSIQSSTFNSSVPVRIVIHGWFNTQNTAEIVDIRKSYLIRGNFNVIVVDWGRGSITPDYGLAKSRINDVSIVLAKLIDVLVGNNFTTLAKVTIVGHSLGGQMAGLTGKKITGGKIATIIALDPANFDYDKPEERVTSTDAVYVEVIHTNAGWIGQLEAIGQSDFYVNYGRVQRGCEWDFTGLCSHIRALTYFAQSLNNNKFIAKRCASAAEVLAGFCTNQTTGFKMGGEPSNSGLTGVFYLKTNIFSPYGQG